MANFRQQVIFIMFHHSFNNLTLTANLLSCSPYQTFLNSYAKRNIRHHFDEMLTRKFIFQSLHKFLYQLIVNRKHQLPSIRFQTFHQYLGRNSVTIERLGGRVTAPIKRTTFGWRNLRIITTFREKKVTMINKEEPYNMLI